MTNKRELQFSMLVQILGATAHRTAKITDNENRSQHWASWKSVHYAHKNRKKAAWKLLYFLVSTAHNKTRKWKPIRHSNHGSVQSTWKRTPYCLSCSRRLFGCFGIFFYRTPAEMKVRVNSQLWEIPTLRWPHQSQSTSYFREGHSCSNRPFLFSARRATRPNPKPLGRIPSQSFGPCMRHFTRVQTLCSRAAMAFQHRQNSICHPSIHSLILQCGLSTFTHNTKIWRGGSTFNTFFQKIGFCCDGDRTKPGASNWRLSDMLEIISQIAKIDVGKQRRVRVHIQAIQRPP